MNYILLINHDTKSAERAVEIKDSGSVTTVISGACAAALKVGMATTYCGAARTRHRVGTPCSP